MSEEWRPTHHPDYDVSDLGRVRSRVRRWRTPDGYKIMRCFKDTHGYPTVMFWLPRRMRSVHRVHCLVAVAFIGPCPIGQEVRHKDGEKENPRLDNLEYGTRSQNMLDAVKQMRLHMQKVTEHEVREIRAAQGVIRQIDLAAAFGVSQSTISAIQRREKWACLD